MSILTKICIVVMLVLILLACPVFITQATVVPNYRDLYETAVEDNELLRHQARNAMLAEQTVQRQRDQLNARLNEITGLGQAELDVLGAPLFLESMRAAADGTPPEIEGLGPRPAIMLQDAPIEQVIGA